MILFSKHDKSANKTEIFNNFFDENFNGKELLDISAEPNNRQNENNEVWTDIPL